MKHRLRVRHGAPAARPATRRGFSLVEMIVAMTIFAIVMAALGGLAVQIAVQGRSGLAVAEKNAAFTDNVNALSMVPFELLPGRAGCTHVAESPYPRTECVTVVNLSAKVRRVTIVITGDGGMSRPDTVQLDRTPRPKGNPFNTP